MKKLINATDAVVPDALRGLVWSHPGLALLDGHDIVVRADAAEAAARGEVALISGGGAGHEPAHAGYDGVGMLTAAVTGDVFTSPSTDAVLAAIRTVAGPAGVLLIVKNYTGDRLNFGLAAEIARTEGIPVEMVIVADDVALAAEGDHAGRRGIAGTVLVHKICGAAAAAGESLAGVHAIAQHAIGRIATMGVALTPCTVPAAGRPGFTLGDDEIELGLGIHGEAGVRRASIAPAAMLVPQLLDPVIADLGLAAGDRVVLLVNNLGGTPTLELSLVAGEALAHLTGQHLRVERAWCGSFLTALEMAGVSLSLMKLDDGDLGRLDAATRAPAWPPAHVGRIDPAPKRLAAPGRGPAPDGGAGPGDATRDGSPDLVPDLVPDLEPALRRICADLIAAEAELTRLDQRVGDGDLGISLARGARAVLAWLDAPAQAPADGPTRLRTMSATLRRSLGGTSGPLYSIGLLRAAGAWQAAPNDLGPVAVAAAALTAACDAIAEIGGAREGDCTMLDALLPAARAVSAAAGPDPGTGSPGGLAGALEAAVTEARHGCAATARTVARRGRASYLGDRAIGHVDPGAHAVVVWLAAWAGSVAQRSSQPG